ncbi:amidohydrolase [Rhodoplanes elegans]|uniref:Amidohydrolase n=1 Tax=Rhodoplanes elegans TaxID=29408 RepID=A0A327KSK1_9BRAD|nr:amidohydrolase family protein [Rhodoplanes elegans]MBK5957786.1 amidohydrolase [Rhodoplanes elegans]RAI40976.1 amidohydrolase [Rhodoplanes elegans]
MDLLIRNATAIMTGGAGSAARAAGPDIRLRGSRIAAIGALAPEPGERVLDATDCVVYPGWINTHHHLFQSLMKGIPAGINLQLAPWLSAVPVAYRRFVDAETLRIAATIGIAELVLSGCTTIADHHYAYWPGMGFDGSALLFELAEQFGVRFVLMRGGATKVREIDLNPPPEARPETLDDMLASVSHDVGRFHQTGGDAMRKVILAPTTPTWSVHAHELPEFAAAARKMGIGLHSHLSESLDYVHFCRDVHGCTPLEFVQRHDWLGPDVFFAHLCHMQPEEIRLMAETGTGIAHCPQSNCRLGSGIAPAPALARLGGRVSLGVDGAGSNEAADMINESHMAWLVHRARDGAASVTVEDVISWGTAGGATVLGLSETGTLAPGMAADLMVYSLDHPRYAGLHDPAIAPVAGGGQAHVKWGFCNGRLIVEDGRIPGLDLPGLFSEARRAVGRMVI